MRGFVGVAEMECVRGGRWLRGGEGRCGKRRERGRRICRGFLRGLG